jgi:HPt (histidine-containing phosphotransfer) domain-containing protein
MSQIINMASVEEARSIMKDKFPMMIEYFLEDAVMYIKSIEEGVVANDASMVKSPAHTIKSSANQMGAEKMSEIAKQMEQIANEMIDGGTADFSQLATLFEQLKAAFAEAEQELKKL